MVRLKAADNVGGRQAAHDAGDSHKAEPSARPSKRLAHDARLKQLSPRAASGLADAPSQARVRSAPPGRSTGRDEAADDHAQPPAASFAARASSLAGKALKLSWRTYVGVAAVAAGYGAVRQAGIARSRSAGSAPGAGALIDLPTVYQARADVLQRHGKYIPADSACHAIEPQITLDLPSGKRGYLNRHKDKPVRLAIREGLPRNVGAHTARHEFLHCFCHADIVLWMGRSPHGETVEESITEHYADQFPDHPNTMNIGDLPLANGKVGVEAAAELERVVGKKTLERAYFKGDPRAIQKVGEAVVNIWPKRASGMAWAGIFRLQGQTARQMALAECFVGASLLYTGKPPEDGAIKAYHLMPIGRFADISPSQLSAMRRQAEAAQAKHGATFDQAFCNWETSGQQRAMDKIAPALHANWQPVLR